MLRTTLLLGALTGVIMAMGNYMGGSSGMTIAFVIAVAMNFGAYWFSDKMVLRAYSAREVTEAEAPQLVDPAVHAREVQRKRMCAGLERGLVAVANVGDEVLERALDRVELALPAPLLRRHLRARDRHPRQRPYLGLGLFLHLVLHRAGGRGQLHREVDLAPGDLDLLDEAEGLAAQRTAVARELAEGEARLTKAREAIDANQQRLKALPDEIAAAGNEIDAVVVKLRELEGGILAREEAAAEAQARAGQFDQAIAAYKALAERQDDTLPLDGILMQLGRTYVSAGKRAEAQQTFNRIVQEFPESQFTAEARQQLDALKRA